jgi:hypothetical protein
MICSSTKKVKKSDGIIRFVVDPQHGLQDLERKLLRTVGEPDKRFSEDALRILR